jgi:hypothetical protein
MAPVGARPRRRALPYLAAGAGFALLGGVVAAYVRLPGYARRTAEARALECGVVLRAEGADVGLGWVRLRGVTFAPAGVAGVRGASERVTVDLAGFTTPSRVTARSATVEVEGPVGALAGQLDAWSKRFPAAGRPPVAADGIALRWREAGEAPWLDLAGGAVEAGPEGGTFRARASSLFGVPAGEASFGWAAGRDEVVAGFGHPDPERAPLRLEAVPGTPLKGRVRVAPTPLPALGALLGVAVNEPDVSAEALVALTLSPGAPTSPCTATCRPARASCRASSTAKRPNSAPPSASPTTAARRRSPTPPCWPARSRCAAAGSSSGGRRARGSNST